MNNAQLKEHLLQSLVHERGGTLVYQTALECTLNDDLREEWEKYLEQTRNHVVILSQLCEKLGWDPGVMTPGCKIVQHNGLALVAAMKMALAEGDAEAAQLVACDSVLLAETKDHANWEIICEVAKSADGTAGEALKGACEEVEDEEDEHLYHTQGWARELRLQALGLKAVLPPPEEKKDVKSASEAEQAKKSR
jgi:rubrerythrin